MTEWATAVIDCTEKESVYGIVCVKGHDNLTEAKAFAFDEILRMANDFCEGDVKELKVSFATDVYDECVMKVEADDGSAILVKCDRRDEEEQK